MNCRRTRSASLFLLGILITTCHAKADVTGTVVKLNVAIHAGLGNEFPAAYASKKLASASKDIASRTDRTGCSDWTACISLTKTPTAYSFGADDDGWEDADFASDNEALTMMEANAYPDRDPGMNVLVVRTFNIANEPEQGFAITADPRIMFVVAAFDPYGDEIEGEAWSHEFGHCCGLLDTDGQGCGNNIMRTDVSGLVVQDQLTEFQASYMENTLASLEGQYDYITAGAVACDPTSLALVQDVDAQLGAGGVQITFRTASELYTESFEVARVDPSSGLTLYSVGTATGVPGPNRWDYSILDPGGAAGANYRIIEHQIDGRPDLTYGVAIVGQSTSPQRANGWSTYDMDSLAAAVGTFQSEGGGGPTDIPDFCSNRHLLYGVPQYELLCPDSLAPALDNYAAKWRARGVYTIPVKKSRADSCAGGYRGWIRRAAATGTKYFLLVGDANDHSLWDDPAAWPYASGWLYPGHYYFNWRENLPPTFISHVPSQPTKDLLPTYYQSIIGSGDDRWAWWTPYFATDVPYADVDDDSLPDVIVGRLPASSSADILAYTAKLDTWLSNVGGTLGSNAAIVTYAVDHGLTPAWPTAFAVDTLRSAFPPGVHVSEATLEKFGPAFWGSYGSDSIAAIANAAASGGSDVIVWNLNSSDRYENTGFWKVRHHWERIPIAQTARPFISVGLSCGMNNFDMTEEYDSLGWNGAIQYLEPRKPLIEKLLFDPARGPIAQIAPTRASFGRANPLFGREFIKRLYSQGNSVGRAFLLAQRAMIEQHPGYRDLFKSYVLLGDPRLGATTVTGVPEAGANRLGVDLGPPTPNPFNPSTRMRFHVDRSGPALLSIFDVHGRLVRRLVAEPLLAAGWHEVHWTGVSDSGTPVGTGIYFARLQVGTIRKTQKLVLLR